MSNVLGKCLIDCSDKYKEKKELYESFDEFFSSYLEENTLDNNTLLNIINDFLLSEFLDINESTSNEEIESILSSLEDKLFKEKAIKRSCNVKELMGYILLGNLLKK